MKIRAIANGNVIEADDVAAEELIKAGVYEKVDDKKPAKEKADTPVQPKRRKSR